jgi:hypothetical protein
MPRLFFKQNKQPKPFSSAWEGFLLFHTTERNIFNLFGCNSSNSHFDHETELFNDLTTKE